MKSKYKICSVCGIEIKRKKAWLCPKCYLVYYSTKRRIDEQVRKNRKVSSYSRDMLKKYGRPSSTQKKKTNCEPEKALTTIRHSNGKIIETRGQFAWGPSSHRI